MSEFVVGTVGLIAAILIVAAAFIVASHHRQLEACARQHNVYACHMVAVPSEKEEAQ